MRFNRTIWLRQKKLDVTWMLIVMTTAALFCSICVIIVEMCVPDHHLIKPGHSIDWDGRIYVKQSNGGSSAWRSRSDFYKFSTPREHMCFFPTFLEGEGMPKLHSAFADPLSHNVVFIGTRFLVDNCTSETFLAHFENGKRRLCDPIVNDYLSFGYISQFNIVLICPIPQAFHKRDNFTLTLQRISNVKRYRRYVYDNLTICKSGASKFQRYQLTACTMVRNMDHYITEWITFHRYVGIQHFFLYDNEPEETSTLRQTVRDLNAEGVVTVIPWTYKAQGQKTYLEVQIAHENDCIWRNRYHTKWMLKIDVDEFVQPMNKNKRKITDYLQDPRFDKLGAIKLQNWFFGRHLNNSRKTNDSIIEVNTWRPSEPSPLNCGHDKNILQPRNVHYFKIHAIKVGGDGLSANPYNELRLVHYRQDNARTRYFDLPPFSVQDFSMVELINKARQSLKMDRIP